MQYHRAGPLSGSERTVTSARGGADVRARDHLSARWGICRSAPCSHLSRMRTIGSPVPRSSIGAPRVLSIAGFMVAQARGCRVT